MNTAIEDEFYEDDEPPADVMRAFAASPHGLTAAPTTRTTSTGYVVFAPHAPAAPAAGPDKE